MESNIWRRFRQKKNLGLQWLFYNLLVVGMAV